MSDSRVDFVDTDEENQDENYQEIENPAQILYEEDAWDIFEHLDQEYDTMDTSDTTNLRD